MGTRGSAATGWFLAAALVLGKSGAAAPAPAFKDSSPAARLQTPTIPGQPSTIPGSSGSVDIDAANAALAAGDYGKALNLLTALNRQTPNNPQVLYDLGLALESLHPDDPASAEAAADYRAAIDANPLFPLPHVALGLMLARSGQMAQAREQLQTAAKIPDVQPELKARALRALARLDLNTANVRSASDELAQALELTSETPADTLLSAEIAAATPDLDAAEQAYRRYLTSRRNDPDATAALAHVLVAERRPAEAEALLREALTAHPDDPALVSQLAATLLASGDQQKIAQAAPLLEKLHAARPADGNVTRVLARFYVESGHPEQAEALYAQLTNRGAADADPTLLDAYGETLLRLHRPADAEKLLKQAIANRAGFPSNDAFADAAMHLAFAAEEIDDLRETLRALELRATVSPPSLAALFLEATARDALHQSSQALDLYKRFLAEAHGTLPEQEAKARERVAALGNRR